MIELSAEILEVVRFAVICDPVAGLWIVHRLMTGGGSVDDREARVAEDHFAVWERAACDPAIIRAAMFLRAIHADNSILRR